MEPLELLDGIRPIVVDVASWLSGARPDGRVGVSDTKSSPRDVVTELDKATEARIAEAITTWRPDDGLIGEEGGVRAGSSGVDWVVDPIDGTVNFIYGIGSWAISVAARRDGVEVAGVVHDLVTGVTYGAALGAGAWAWGPDGQRSLSGPPSVPVEQMLVATGFHYTTGTRLRQAAATAKMLPQIRDIRRLGAASLDLVAVADGRVDAYVEEGLKQWDHAAGALIAREAGAVVSGLDAGPDERLVVACNSERIDEFMELLESCGF